MTPTITSVIQYPAEYQVTYSDGSVSFVPLDSHNADYGHVQAWIAAGGTVTTGTMG